MMNRAIDGGRYESSDVLPRARRQRVELGPGALREHSSHATVRDPFPIGQRVPTGRHDEPPELRSGHGDGRYLVMAVGVASCAARRWQQPPIAVRVASFSRGVERERAKPEAVEEAEAVQRWQARPWGA